MIRNLSRRARQLEFGAAVAFIAVLAVLLLHALNQLQEESEKLMVELTVRNINTGLMLEQAHRVMGGQENTLLDLARGNPIEWLVQPPEGYVGAQACAQPGLLAAGQWCWEASSRTLYYRPRLTGGLKLSGDMPWLTWRIALPADPAAIRPGTIRMQSAVDYVWEP